MKKIFSILMTVLITFSLTSCAFGLGNQEVVFQQKEYEKYESGFNYVSKKKVSESEYDSLPDEVRDFELEKSEDYDVTYETVQATGSYEEMCTMGVNNEILYPGALVDMSNNSYRPLQIERGPITLSTNLETVTNQSGKLSTTISSPSLSTVRTGIQEIINNNIKETTNVPANISYSIKEVTCEEEFGLNLGFGLQVSKFDLSENFSYDKMNKQTNLVIVLKQVYYTIDMDQPTQKNSRDLFAEKLSSKKINEALEGTIPAYVSSVSYGRIAMITIQTNYAKDEITNALGVAWGKMSEKPGTNEVKQLSVDFDSTLEKISKDSETKIDCYVYGGSSSMQFPITTDTQETLSGIFSQFNGDEKPNGDGALPISYTMRHLDGSIAKIQDTKEYTIKHVTYNPKKLMDWSFLDTLIKNGTLFKNDTLTLDFSAMVDYSSKKENNVEGTDNVENSTNVSGNDTVANRTITIPDNIKELTIIGPNRGTTLIEYENLSFNIDYRDEDNPLTIHLDSISFTADPKEGKGICINSTSKALIIIDFKRTVNLKAQEGAPAINCKNLKITGNGDTTIIGGTGLAGTEKDINGQDGFAAIVSDDLTIDMKGFLKCNGGTGGAGHIGATGAEGTSYGAGGGWYNTPAGGDGAVGGTGGTGGNGSVAIKTNTINILDGEITLTGGTGGAGGIGGTGGAGGKGANADAIGGTSGNGGNSGNGGTGGTGGNGSVAIELDVPTSVTLVDGIGGAGGAGGEAGTPGKAGGTGGWLGASKGKDGAVGQKGENGTPGLSPSEMIETEE